MNAKDIIELFSYDEDEQETFPYLHEYMNLIKDKIPEIEKDREKLRKYALVGLFLDYRACNHMGESLTTEFENPDLENLSDKRLITFKKYFDETIKDSRHYLSKIKFSIVTFFLCMPGIRSLSKKLYKFVIK